MDIYYWLFTPFNEGKHVEVFDVQVGDRAYVPSVQLRALISVFWADVGDWERMAVRTVNGTATQVDYHAHGMYP